MGGSKKSNFSGLSTIPANQLGQDTPNLFKPYTRHMPQQYFGTGPVNDPSAILDAYMQNMPEFLKASRSQNTYVPPPPVPKPSSGGGGGSNILKDGILSYSNPIGLASHAKKIWKKIF